LSDQDAGLSDELVARARAGERGVFERLVVAHQRRVYSLALRMVSDHGIAEDLAQDVFLQLHRKLATIESAAHLTFWLRRVTANRAIDRLRSRPAFETASLDEVDLGEAAGASVAMEGDPLLQETLRRRMLELAPAARAVVVLRYQEDLDPTEIASALDMSINTVKSHLKRSLATLRRQMSDAAPAHVEEVSR
jgi:RNA polymerase sigma-70 factor (ECF subfamily)